MKTKQFVGAIVAIAVLGLAGKVSAAPVIAVDLDTSMPGIQASRTLDPGDELLLDIVYTGDGQAVFDTFTLDVVFHDAGDRVLALTAEDPTAGPIADTAPILALDVFGGVPVTGGDALTIGNFPVPLGFGDGLGGVGITSVGGAPFSLVGAEETIGLFRLGMRADSAGTTAVISTGFPFGVDAELALAGVPVPVTLESATVTVVPLPPGLGLLAAGLLGLLGLLGAGRPNRTACPAISNRDQQ